MPSSPTTSPALSAFLRGIERRAFVFAQVQSGDDDEALALVGRAMRAFRSVSSVTPLSGWPAGFWAMLLAQGGLAAGEAPEPELSHLGAGPRAALLLRLVGGLDLAHAAQVLGVSEPTYRFALQRALQQLGEAGVSYAALGQLRERLHRQVKTLSAHHVEALAEQRGRILRDEAEPPPAVAPPPSPWPPRLAWATLVLLALAFAATWWEPAPPLLPGGVQDLPPETPAEAPAPMPDDAGQVIHPDYPALADPDSEAMAADLAFLSWLAARDGSPPDPETDGARAATGSPLAAAQDQPAFQSLAAGERGLLVPLAGTWPQLDPDTRRQLIGQARHWLALDGQARADLRQRLAAWDALPAADRAARRGHLAAWGNLSATEQTWVRASARDFINRPAPEQVAAREEFEALPAEARQSWWLGPALGEWFSPVQPLFAYVPEDQRPPLLAMLRDLSPQARDDLALLARRLPATERERLRRELLDAPADQREALVHARLGR